MDKRNVPSRAEYLEALKPFLGPERQRTLEKIVGILSLIELAGSFSEERTCI